MLGFYGPLPALEMVYIIVSMGKGLENESFLGLKGLGWIFPSGRWAWLRLRQWELLEGAVSAIRRLCVGVLGLEPGIAGVDACSSREVPW